MKNEFLTKVLMLAIGLVASFFGYESATEMFVTFSAFASLVLVITQWVKVKVPLQHNVVQLISWLIGIPIALIPWFLHLGIFNGIPWYQALFYGFLGSLIANGLADIELIQQLLNSIFKPKKIYIK